MTNAANMTLPSRNSGVFLYVGWQLLMGDVPYRDVWDHKPPLIYFVDARVVRLKSNLTYFLGPIVEIATTPRPWNRVSL